MTSLQIKGLIIIAYSLSLLAGGFYLGWHYEHSKLVAYQVEVAAAGQRAEGKKEAVEAANDQHTKETNKDYATNVANLRGSWADRMHHYPGGSAVPPVPKPPATVDELPADSLPLAGQCAETTLQLESLQEWIRGIVGE